jgi:subtilisin family serine protease
MDKFIRRARFALLVGSCLLAVSVAPSFGAAKSPLPAARGAAVPGELIVVYKPGYSTASLASDGRRMLMGVRSLGASQRGAQFARIKLRPNVDLAQALETYRKDPAVEAVSPNYLRYPMLAPNDTGFPQVWGLHNTGQLITNPSYPTNNPGTADADVDAPEAWDEMVANGASSGAVGSSTVVVAVIDSGVDYTHPDLSGAMWDASSATFGGAAQGSPNHGWDFPDNDDDPYPLNSEHGTHVSGTIAATGNNAIGVPGVAYGVRIMALKVFPDVATFALDADIIAAINYAVENHAHVINMSLGGGGAENPVLTTAVANAVNAGVLVVAAAGNENANNDTTPSWPANYANVASTSAGVISVAATDQRDQRASFSNFGATTVSVGAPGVNILSTVTGRTVKQSETLSGVTADPITWTHCSAAPASCMDNTIFDAGGTNADCAGPACRWGVYKEPDFAFIYGDNDTALTYANNIDGTITSQAINVAGAQRVALRYSAGWELECNNDYVDVEVSPDGGSNWQRLHAGATNVNDAQTDYCTPDTHTHTGRTSSAFGELDVTHDITAYASANLQVRFHFVTNGSTTYGVADGGVEGGFLMRDIYVDVQASDYTTSYRLFNGTSMASPMTAGVAALVKSRYPAYSAAQLKQAVVSTGDSVAALSTTTTSGRRVNARNALVVPSIMSLSPASTTAGAAAFTLTVDGVNFDSSAVVRWNGANRTTTFVSATQLTAAITAADVASAGTASITVSNPSKSTTSAAQAFTINPPPSSGGGGGGCFIATAAYGTPMASDVRYLRAFRDQYLLTNAIGRGFVKAYYTVSPPLADFLRDNAFLRAWVRLWLKPWVDLSRLLVSDQAYQSQTADRP